VANTDVRWIRAPFNGPYGAAVYPRSWQATTAARATLSGAAPGYTYCFSARARDNAGNVSPWSPPRCSAVALDDRSLAATAGWSRVTGNAFYRSTATVTARPGVSLVRTRVQARYIYLVATRSPSSGIVGVYWNGHLVKVVNLHARTTTRQRVLGVAFFRTLHGGTLVIRTLTRQPVQIDGVVLARG
jgi:hypothetical protein